VLLVFPPQGHFTAPYLSLPSLAAYLRSHGVSEVRQMDVNIEAYEHFLSSERLSLALERVRSRGRLEDFPADGLSHSRMERYQTLSEVDLLGETLVDSIEEAKRVLRTESEFYDYERYLWAGRTVEQALRLFSAEFAPTRLTPHGFVMRHKIERTADILAAIEDEAENPYIEYFREQVMPRIAEFDPDVVGISLTFGSQAIPTFTLARMLKAWKPTVHVTVGGGLTAYVGEKLATRPAVFDLVDSLVLLEGEGPLLALVRAIDAGVTDLSSVPNLIWRAADGSVRHNTHADPLDIKALPVPDFDDLPLDLYLSPELVLPLAATRGCYWGKCVFCTLFTVIGPGYRGRTLDQTVEDMRVLKERHGARHYYLAIEDLPPNMARALPDKILEAGLDVEWWCDARLEHEVFTPEVCSKLAAAGCRRIAFGYESASRRVLDAMCKGIDPDKSLQVIRNVREAGISVTLYVMVGFPTETREEALSTLAAILANKELVQEVSVRVFYLDERSEIFKRRAEFAIQEIFPDPEADLQVYYDFRSDQGMSRAEAREVYFEFTRALRSHFPVFQNTNMLYHELKGHYFLYLSRWGSWERLRAEVLDRPRKKLAGASRGPRRTRGLRALELAYDRAEIDRALWSVDANILRPRFQSELLDDEERARAEREIQPIAPSPSVLVHDPSSAEVRCLSPETWELLSRCDGRASEEEILAVYPAEAREGARQCLQQMAEAGFLDGLAPAKPSEVLEPERTEVSR
jgi:radical SAM superfamily enzyme YgiQ (UPF0313 family)